MMRDMPVQSYIVRIYRRARGRPRRLVGVVEEVGTDGRAAFTTATGLWRVLSRSMGRRSPPGRSGSDLA
jgi:hypothetical protein